jgi:hypothetical protein
MWDPSATIAFVLMSGAVGLGAYLSITAARGKKVTASYLRLIIIIPALLLISGLKMYAQIGTESLTFVFGAIIGYILGGRPLQMGSPTAEAELDSSAE